VEADDRPALRRLDDELLAGRYAHVAVRHVMGSHVDAVDAGGVIFSRNCPSPRSAPSPGRCCTAGQPLQVPVDEGPPDPTRPAPNLTALFDLADR
jgi:hypothetical protein